MSLTACAQIGLRSPPPTATVRCAGVGVVEPLEDLPDPERDSLVGGAEQMARGRGASVRPANTPRACGSNTGVRSPAR